MKMKIIIVLLVFAVGLWGYAATVSDVTARQRCPWNGLVDIDYTITGDDTENTAITNDLFYVIDLSGGPNATRWPVSCLAAVPKGGWTDEYKTTKLVLRRIEKGSISGINSGLSDAVSFIMIDKPYYIGVFDVTSAQFMLMTGGSGVRLRYLTNDARPQGGVSYDLLRGTSLGALYPDSTAVDATSVIGILRTKTGLTTLDLPTEAQWEYACRASTTSDYNNGGSTEADLATLGRYKGNQNDGCGGFSGGTTTVGSYAPNRWGLYDMHGSVYEWCLEWYRQDQNRALRGGSYYRDAGYCRSGLRYGGGPYYGRIDVGFRLCCSAFVVALHERVGAYLSLDLVGDLGIGIDADYAAGDKVAVKVEGLAKGLRLVAKNGRYVIEGVPTETVDLDHQPMFARVTVTKADRTKVETLQPIPLAIDRVTAEVNPAAVLGADYALSVTDIWPEADATWTFKGWPAGLKYTAKAIAANPKKGTAAIAPLTVYGKPTKAGVFTITATHKRQVGKATVAETETATLTVWGAADEKSFRCTGQVGRTIEPITVGSAYKGFAGLPAGIRYTVKAIAANPKTGAAAVPANTLYGTPTKAGVFTITATMADPANPKKTVKETFLWSVAAGENGGVLDTFGWGAVNSAVTIREGAGLPDLPSSVAGAAKVTAAGLPAGVKLVFDKATGKWTLTGTPTKAGNYVVTFKTTLNGVTTVERISFIVEPNPHAGVWHGFQDPDPSATAARFADVTVAANGTVKLVLTEATTNANAKGVVQSAVVKTTATVKRLDAGGRTATLPLPRNRKDPASADRTCVLDFGDGSLKIGETTLTLLRRKAADLPGVTTAVFEEVAGGETNAYAYLTATYRAKNGSCAVAGKLWDGTAVKGTAYALDAGEGVVLSTVHVTDKAKNAVTVTLVWTDEGELLALVSENGRQVSIGEPGYDPLWTSCEAADLKGKKFGQLLPDCRALTLVTDVGELALDIPEKMRAAAVSAQGLAKFTITDADGYKWVCELLPVEADGGFQFRGVATGTKRGEPTEVFPAYAR